MPKLEGTIGDSEIYIIEGEEEGGSLLIIGGTHPNEPAGQLTSILFLENLEVKKGKVFIVTEANRSAYAHSYPQEGAPFFYTIETNYGERKFKFGARATSPSDQWPFPDVYVHKSSGQKMSSHDTRNLNRAYPGDPNGTYTEQVAYAIKELIVQNDITITIDLHESLNNYLNPPYIGNQVIAGNPKSAFYAMSLVAEFNQKYQTPNNVPFIKDEKPKDGSINQYCSQDQNRIVFTFETDRSLKLEERIRQQLTLIDIFLNQIKPS